MKVNRGNNKQYIVGSGRVEFNQFPDENGIVMPEKAKGFRYLGASREMSLNVESETLEHESSECGFKVVDEEIVIKSKLGGTLVLDTISPENLAMWFAGDAESVVQEAQSNVVEVLKVFPTYGYQLGVTKTNPNGVFDAEIVSIKTFASKADADANSSELATLENIADFELHENRAYLMMAKTDKIAKDGTYIRVEYNLRKSMRNVVISKGKSIIGALTFHGCNAVGENYMYYIPRARLSANGDFALKSDEYLNMSFEITALKDDDKALLYINGVAQT